MASLGCAACTRRLPVMKRCVRCRSAFYCSKECQERHWPIHRNRCIIFRGCVIENEVPMNERCSDQMVSEHHCLNSNKATGLNMDVVQNKDEETSDRRNEVLIRVKYNHVKHELRIPKHAVKEEPLAHIANHLGIPVERMRLICKGKQMNKENISHFLKANAIFQAFGEQAEPEDGLEVKDIEVLMAQMSVERSVAVKALRKTGDLIDAIFYVSDKM
ncbi:hypothetical protein NDU88_001725 [Pleurodeles waltl]|uniref:MYND-type domain-containing protein n=1 Tax=Pleurodeles waltl TaxID=8319 RepID=A0AAV7VCA5_PLEWA|nr:hypothetical protein NDU88_001725 [Pleurodeles waltl]